MSAPVELVSNYYDSLLPYWHPVMPYADLPVEKPVGITLLGRDIVLVRLNGEVCAYSDICPHFQAKLSLGEVNTLCGGQDVLRCRYHGWAFEPAGQCIDIPQVPTRPVPIKAKLEKFHVRIEQEMVWICLAPKPDFDLPIFPEIGDGLHPLPIQRKIWKTSLVRMILSALDDYHFAWLHEGVLGDRSEPFAPSRQVAREGKSLRSAFYLMQPPNVTNDLKGGEKKNDLVRVDYEMRVEMPNVIKLFKRNAGGGLYIVWFACFPIRNDETVVFWRVLRNYDLGEEGDLRVLRMENLIQDQDLPVVESQRPWLMKSVPIKGPDDSLLEYIKWLQELGIPANI